MWKDYSSGYIKNNRSSGMSVMIAAFISALLLSLLLGLFYNAWKYEIESIEQEEGGWQSRIVGAFTQEDMESIKNFANVKDVVISEKGAQIPEPVIDIYFDDMGAVLDDTMQIAKVLGVSSENVIYNHELLAMYMIRDPQDTAPRLLFPLFILIVGIASFSLIIVIHNSFAVSMNARIHQFGIFSSIGATPKQIRSCLLQEAAALCILPILIGNLLGILISMGIIHMANDLLGSDVAGRHDAVFGYHPLVLVATLLLTVATIWISAWMPARKLSRLTPLEAIKNTGELQLKRKKKSPLLTCIFGLEGELAGGALKAQKRALRTASLSLIFSFLAFTIMQSFFALSGISTRETYFERYQGVWDIMVTVKDTDVDSFSEAQKLQEISGIRSAIVYQKAMAKRIIAEDEISEDMKSFGGFTVAGDNYVRKTDGGWLVNVPIVILDDASFLAYCEQIGIMPQLNGAVIWNQIRDVTNPDFRHPRYMPYVKGENAVSILRQSGKEEMTAEVPVLSYTEKVPVLREEYATLDYYELVHFIPVSLWKEIKGQIGGSEEDAYICMLGRENVTAGELDALQGQVDSLIAGNYKTESENRIQEAAANDKQIQGMMTIFGGFCVLLAVIGIGNVFSNTLGFVRQRKREFARYMSVGMTQGEIKKMFCVEALTIAGRPILITLPLAAVTVGYMLKISYVEVGTFLAEAPFIPIMIFMLAIWGIVAFAYYLGWRNIRKINLAEVLRDDTMM
ncbi:FtsX-like permease family protein [Petralouisia muris]|uniref:FtsX-like permease family protein n=1 Tax=Petralouisia muris TaxID=3032872 RepID=A0AC61RQH1_9FIRM|nr:ABC transporter permease [Petralouisia muris]TGY91301.1 FtsX-like permease family protein [Petralouisia muris]